MDSTERNILLSELNVVLMFTTEMEKEFPPEELVSIVEGAVLEALLSFKDLMDSQEGMKYKTGYMLTEPYLPTDWLDKFSEVCSEEDLGEDDSGEEDDDDYDSDDDEEEFFYHQD